jgi:uncharacterized protein YegL
MLQTSLRMVLWAMVSMTLYTCRAVDCSMTNCKEIPPDIQNAADGLILTVVHKRFEPPALVTVMFKIDRNNGPPVIGLPATSFEILDDDRIDSPSESIKSIENTRIFYSNSVLLLLDLSGSVTTGENLEILKQAARAFVEETASLDQVEIAISWFDGGSEIRELSPFTQNTDSLSLVIQSLTPRLPTDKSTNLNGAIVKGLSLLEEWIKKPHRDIAIRVGSLVVFTDGTDQAGRLSPEETLEAIDKDSVNLFKYSIGMRGEIDEAFLREIGRDGSVFADALTQLVPAFQQISARIRDEANSYYVLKYCSPRRSADIHELDIRAFDDSSSGSVKTWYSSAGFEGGCDLNSLTFR